MAGSALRRARSIVREVWHESIDDGIVDLAAAVTFFMVFAAPAAVLAFTSALGSLRGVISEDLADDAERETVEFVRDNFGDSRELEDTVRSLFDQPNSGLVTFGLLLALWAMSRGFASLVRALDGAYDLDSRRSFLNVRVHAVILAVGTVAVSTGALGLFTLAPIWGPLRVPLVALILMLWSATIFHIGPDHHTPWRYDLPGAVLTTVCWLGLGGGFGLYIRVASTGNDVLGAIGGLLIGLTFVWLAMVFLLVGAELNAVLAQRAGLSVQGESTERVKRLVVERLGRVRRRGRD